MRRHPDWLKVRIGGGKTYVQMKSLLRNAKLHTICEEAKCPNIAECFGNGTAVFLILGDTCTRNCRYCYVHHGKPKPINQDEPRDVADSVTHLKLNYVVVTSVTRDDLSDGGAQMFAETVTAIKERNPQCMVEVLIPDFQGNKDALRTVIASHPAVINHNIEVVDVLFPSIRPEGDYHVSLDALRSIKLFDDQMKTKSGFMIGLGENDIQIQQTMYDLRAVNVDFLTIGQYLQPSKAHAPIKKYYTPTEFDMLRKQALDLGFSHVESGPLVRSSYHAEQVFC